MTGELALFGGTPTRARPFPPHPVLGDEERDAVLAVLDKGRLSAFIAGPGQFFLGGEHIQEFERRFAESFGKAHAVSFNSATAALHAAVVAVGVEPGAEVIVPPYTFTSTATCALMNNSIPVFADVEPDFYCLSPATFERAVSDLTQAVIPVHLFGQAADMDGIMEVARARGIKVIEDCAQAPGAHYKGRPLGTMGDCGIFSFTESKTMTTGEGGMLVTDDPDIAAMAQMVRNHGEVVAPNQTARTYRADLLGWNYRMTELDAAIGIVQLDKLPDLNRHRQMLADHLTKGLASLPGLDPPETRAGCDHVYFVYAMRFDAGAAGLSRKDFVAAMAAEGIPVAPGYVRPLYLNPIYHERRPAAFRLYTGNATYDKGLCPVAERLHEQDLVLTGVARPPATTEDMDDILAAAEKVLAARGPVLGLSEPVRVVASIEARMSSSRLPGKVLLDVAGRPALEWVVRRLRQARRVDDVVVATTDSPQDDVLEDWARRTGVAVHRGSEDDVLGRVVGAQRAMASDVVVEVTGDSTLVDPDVIDLGITTFLENDCDVVSNVWKRSYPRGVQVQVFPLALLAEVDETVPDPAVREHVSIYFYENPDRYRIMHLFAPRRCWRPDLRLSLDYPEDHQLICEVYRRLLPRHGEEFRTEDIMALLEADPALVEINRSREQKPIR